jgi:Flp pilus assembly secretin CpaC
MRKMIVAIVCGIVGCSAETVGATPTSPEKLEAPTAGACATEAIGVGEARSFPQADVKRFSVSRAGIVDVRPAKGLTIVGKQPGTTEIRAFAASGEPTCVRYEVTPRT